MNYYQSNYLNPFIIEHGNSYPKANGYDQTACWADDLKSDGVMANEDWHFATFPYINSAISDNLDNLEMILWLYGL